jgi:DNA-binding NtrC family response regulator
MNEKESLVCIIDDDLSIRESLSDLLASEGKNVKAFSSAQEFLTNPPLETPSCLVLDVQMPGISGLDLQRELGHSDSRIPIIFMTGYGDIPMSVRAMKAGAFEFLTKPCRDEDLLRAIGQAIERGRQMEQSKNARIDGLSYPGRQRREAVRFSEIVGSSAALRQLLRQIELVAPSDAAVLILGETGTGKELIARAVHQHSRRRDKPLVRVNCTSIPKNLFEKRIFRPHQGRVYWRYQGSSRPFRGRLRWNSVPGRGR